MTTRSVGRLTHQDIEMIERTRIARELLSSKWKVDLLYLLARGVRRYSRLYDNLRGASKKMLTDSLRSLERDGHDLGPGHLLQYSHSSRAARWHRRRQHVGRLSVL